MKIIETTAATATLAEYASHIEDGPVIVTSEGRPVAALVALENADLETVSLASNREFLELIQRARARVQSEGGVASDEMRRRFE